MSLYVFDLLLEVGATGLNVGWIFCQQLCWQCFSSNNLVLTRVSLECAHSCHEHCSIRNETRCAALDIEETLGTHVCAKACFGDEEIATVDTDHVADDGRVTVRNVSKRSCVHDHWCVFESLQQVWLDCFTHDDGH